MASAFTFNVLFITVVPPMFTFDKLASLVTLKVDFRLVPPDTSKVDSKLALSWTSNKPNVVFLSTSNVEDKIVALSTVSVEARVDDLLTFNVDDNDACLPTTIVSPTYKLDFIETEPLRVVASLTSNVLAKDTAPETSTSLR